MAYYHRKVPLSRYEQFELSGDVKNSSVQKKVVVQKPKDFGAGIAAQFGLVKKTVGDGSTDGNPAKKKKKLSHDQGNSKMCKSSGKKIPPDKYREKERMLDELKQQKSSKKSLPREINFLSPGGSDGSDDNRTHVISKSKSLDQSKKKRNEHYSDSNRSSKKRRHSTNSLVDDDVDDDDDDDDGNIDFSEQDEPIDRITSYEKTHGGKSRKYHRVSSHEIKKKGRPRHDNDVDDDDDDDDDDDNGNSHNKSKTDRSVTKGVSDPKLLSKRRTSSTSLLNKRTGVVSQFDLSSSIINRSKSTDKPIERVKSANYKSKDEVIRSYSKHSDVGASLQRTNNKSSNTSSNSKSSQPETREKLINIKSESIDDCNDTPQNISKKAPSTQDKSRLKSSTLLTTGSKNAPTVIEDDVPFTSIRTNHERESSKVVEIKVEPDTHNYEVGPKSPSKKCFEKNASSTTQSFSNTSLSSGSKRKPQARIINLGNDIRYIGKTIDVRDCKGEDLSDWFVLVHDRLREKSTKTDNTVLNYFITLHSRFKVMETMEMNDLEVLPEEEPEKNVETQPIRIFTNLSKDHYKQYLDEECLNSIPELIITKLYPRLQ